MVLSAPVGRSTRRRPAKAAPACSGEMRNCGHSSRRPCRAGRLCRRSRLAAEPPFAFVPGSASYRHWLPVPGCRNDCHATVGRAAIGRNAGQLHAGPAGNSAARAAAAIAKHVGRFRHLVPSIRRHCHWRACRAVPATGRPAIRRRRCVRVRKLDVCAGAGMYATGGGLEAACCSATRRAIGREGILRHADARLTTLNPRFKWGCSKAVGLTAARRACTPGCHHIPVVVIKGQGECYARGRTRQRIRGQYRRMRPACNRSGGRAGQGSASWSSWRCKASSV